MCAATLFVDASRSLGFLTAAAQTPGGSIACGVSGYKAMPGLMATNAADGLTLTWDADKNQELRLRFTINSGTPTIQELAARRKGATWAPLATNVTPEFRVVTGKRRMASEQVGSLAGLGLVKLGTGADRFKDVPQAIIDEHKWNAFWDAPLYLDDKRPPRA